MGCDGNLSFSRIHIQKLAALICKLFYWEKKNTEGKYRSWQIYWRQDYIIIHDIVLQLKRGWFWSELYSSDADFNGAKSNIEINVAKSLFL